MQFLGVQKWCSANVFSDTAILLSGASSGEHLLSGASDSLNVEIGFLL